MTSVLRRYAQIDPRVQFFSIFPLSVVDGWKPTGLGTPAPVMDISSFLTAFTDISDNYNGYYQLKDLGRQITVYNSNVAGDPHVALFRQVMGINGPNKEGITSNIAYICVWVDGINPNFLAAPVARIG